jgi:hypothetical protein
VDDRNAAFQDGALHPAAKAVGVVPFHPTSALDQTRASSNGLGDQTYNERLVGLSGNGLSDSAYTAARNLRYPLLNTQLFGGT